MSEKLFCASIHCMDGRVQLPIINFIQQNYGYKYVDCITEPGPNKILAEGAENPLTESILNRLSISVNKHKGDLIFVSGHYDCAGNPTEKETQLAQIEKSVVFLKGHYPDVEIVKLWIDENWKVSVL
jgi:hypothetical protein